MADNLLSCPFCGCANAVPATRTDLVDTVIVGFDGDYPSTATLLRTIRALASSQPAEGSGGELSRDVAAEALALITRARTDLDETSAQHHTSIAIHALRGIESLLRAAVPDARDKPDDALALETMRRRAEGFKEASRGNYSAMLCDDVLNLLGRISARDERIAELERDAYEDEVAVDALCDAAGGADNVGSAVDWCLRTKERIATLESDLATTRAAWDTEVRELRRELEDGYRGRIACECDAREAWRRKAEALESRLAAMQAVVDAVEDWGCSDITAVSQLRADANYCDVEGMNGLADRLRRLADALATLPAADAEASDPRPNCIACGKKWTPGEGTDATRVSCPDCWMHGRYSGHTDAAATDSAFSGGAPAPERTGHEARARNPQPVEPPVDPGAGTTRREPPESARTDASTGAVTVPRCALCGDETGPEQWDPPDYPEYVCDPCIDIYKGAAPHEYDDAAEDIEAALRNERRGCLRVERFEREVSGADAEATGSGGFPDLTEARELCKGIRGSDWMASLRDEYPAIPATPAGDSVDARMCPQCGAMAGQTCGCYARRLAATDSAASPATHPVSDSAEAVTAPARKTATGEDGGAQPIAPAPADTDPSRTR